MFFRLLMTTVCLFQTCRCAIENSTTLVPTPTSTKSQIFLNETQSNITATGNSILNTTAKSILNTTEKINLNMTKKMNLTAAAASPKLDEIVKKMSTSVDEIKKTTRKSWLILRVIICVISIYGVYKIYVIIQEMRQKKRERDLDDLLVLPSPSGTSPKNSLKRSASSGFFSQDKPIRAKSPENPNPNLRQRFASNTEQNKWHV